MEIAVLALGCFWGPEIKFSKIEGIIKTEVGYCGGNSTTTTYKEVCTGSTNHAEVVKLDFDEKIISYEKILKIFFQIHDPTTLNSQGPDFGTQYRSEIFILNDNQKTVAEKVLNDLEKAEIRASLDSRNETVGKKIRESEQNKVPFMGIIGDKEINNNSVSVRGNGGEEMGEMNIDELINFIKKEEENSLIN